MKTKVKITGQISGNFALLNKLPYYSGQKKDGMFNSFIITYDTKYAAQDALQHLCKRLREDSMEHKVKRHNSRIECVMYDASQAYLIDLE